MLNLKVHIDENSGFCFGVVFAIELAEEILNQEGHLYSLGDIVHNDEEIKRLVKKGLKIINYDDLQNLRNEKVLIRAHGEPPSTYEIAMRNNLELIDASCPVVLKLQNRIKDSFDKNEKLYIYGKEEHAEVVGLVGQTGNKAVVFQNIEDLNLEELPSSITLYSQTTENTNNFYQVVKQIAERGITVKVNDTICRQVSNRDKELREFVKHYNKIVFVAGRKSSNGKVLFRVCQEANPDTFFVSDKEELKKEWFKENESIGICGATSTPMWLMLDVKERLLKF